jgi:hypothetical protein
MTRDEFESQRKKWSTEWYTKWRLLDIDFETYMIMNGLPELEFKKLNSPQITVDREYIIKWIARIEAIQKREPISYNSYLEGQLTVLRDILEQKN